MAKTIQEQMAENSAAWKTADATQKTVLHDANLKLAQQTGQAYNSGTGTYSPLKEATLGRDTGSSLVKTAEKFVPFISANVDPVTGGNTTEYRAQREGDTGIGVSAPAAVQQVGGNPPAPVTPQQKSPYEMIMDMYNQSYEAQAQKLKALRDTRLAGLVGQDTLINNQAQGDLNANDVSGARNASALRERLAADGLLQGGDFITQQTAQNTAQGQNANNINMDKAQRLQNLAAERDAINNNASADDLALLQQTNADRMGAQIGQLNADRGYGLDLAGLSGVLPGGGQTVQGKTAELQNVGQAQQNILNQYKIDAYPEESKAQAQLVQQQLTSGQLGIDAAKYNLEQLKDPNSNINLANKLDLQMKQLDAKNYPETAKLELEKLRKTVADIGKVHTQPQSEADKAADKVKLAVATKQLSDIEKGIMPGDKPAEATIVPYKTNPSFAEDVAHLKSNPADAAKIDSNAQAFILAYGYDGYLALRKAAGLPDPEAP